jgi:hypothetical protein
MKKTVSTLLLGALVGLFLGAVLGMAFERKAVKESKAQLEQAQQQLQAETKAKEEALALAKNEEKVESQVKAQALTKVQAENEAKTQTKAEESKTPTQTPVQAQTTAAITPEALTAKLGEDPGPVYTQMVLQWAKVTNFAQNAAEVIVGKFKLDMENDPKMKKLVTPALMGDLEQFFYELFLSPETIGYLSRLYAQYFTLDDMAELLKFYQSPVGQKLIKADATLKVKTQLIGQDLLVRHQKDYMKIVAKYLAPGAVPASKETAPDVTPESPPEMTPEAPAAKPEVKPEVPKKQ